MIKEINAQTLNDWVKTGDAVIVDVREANEYAEGHIDGAVSIPLSVFPQTYDHESFPKDKKIVFQCLGGVRSMNACKYVVQENEGQDNVYNLAGGIRSWLAAGLPVTK